MYPILLLLGACGALSACSIREDAFFIDGAEFVEAAYLSRLDRRTPDEVGHDRTNYGVHAHRLQAGRGSVIGHRRFDAGDWMAVDDETFDKLTLWLPAGRAGDASFDLSHAEGIVAIYAAGGSAWPQAGCSGYLDAGIVTVVEEGVHLHVTVDARLHASGNSRRHGQCDGRTVQFDFRAAPITVGQLTPWLGKASEHVYRETYR